MQLQHDAREALTSILGPLPEEVGSPRGDIEEYISKQIQISDVLLDHRR